MPRRYAKKRTRRPRKRRYVRRMQRAQNQMVPSGMPRQRRAYMRYCEQVNLTVTTGILTSNVFRANSPYDPNYSGAGHQPMGYDQWSALFNHYVVTGSRIKATLLSDTSNSAPVSFGAYLTDTNSIPYTDWASFREAKKGSVQNYIGRQSKSRSVVSKYSAKKFFNVKDVKDNTDRLGAAVTSDPSEECYFIIWCNTLDGGSDTYQVLVEIDYIIDFSEPKDLTTS